MRKLTMRRIVIVLLCSSALAPGRGRGLVAQARPDALAKPSELPEPAAWSIAVTASLASFRGAAATVPAASGTDGAADITIRPSQGIALEVAAVRQWRAWAVSLGASYLPTRVEAVSNDVAVQDRTKDLERVRFAFTVARQLARVGAGRLEIRAGPALDNWSADGDDGRTVPSGNAALALRLPAGPVTLENVLGLGWSPGPFRAAELPEGYTRESLRTMSVGVGVRFGF